MLSKSVDCSWQVLDHVDFFPSCGCVNTTNAPHEGQPNTLRESCLRTTQESYLLSTRQQLYGHLPLISKIVQVRQMTCESPLKKQKLTSMTFFYGPQHIDVPVLGNSQELSYISSMWTLNVIWSTCQEQWMIVTDGRERESGKFMLSVRFDEESSISLLEFRKTLELATVQKVWFSQSKRTYWWV